MYLRSTLLDCIILFKEWSVKSKSLWEQLLTVKVTIKSYQLHFYLQKHWLSGNKLHYIVIFSNILHNYEKLKSKADVLSSRERCCKISTKKMGFGSWESDLTVTSDSLYKKSWVSVGDLLWCTTSRIAFCIDTRIRHPNILKMLAALSCLSTGQVLTDGSEE